MPPSPLPAHPPLTQACRNPSPLPVVPSPRPSPIPSPVPVPSPVVPTCTYCNDFCVTRNGVTGAGVPPAPTGATCAALVNYLRSVDPGRVYLCAGVNATCVKACGTGRPDIDGTCAQQQQASSSLVRPPPGAHRRARPTQASPTPGTRA